MFNAKEYVLAIRKVDFRLNSFGQLLNEYSKIVLFFSLNANAFDFA